MNDLLTFGNDREFVGLGTIWAYLCRTLTINVEMVCIVYTAPLYRLGHVVSVILVCILSSIPPDNRHLEYHSVTRVRGGGPSPHHVAGCS